MYVVLTLVSLLPALVVLRVLYLQLGEAPVLRAQGEAQASTHVEIPALRGTVLDAAGRVLATNAARYDLALDPTARGFSAKADLFFDKLSDLTGTPAQAYRQRVRNRRSRQYVMVHRGLTESQKEAVESLGIPGLLLDASHTRRYTYGPMAAHVLGHTGRDGHGLAGLELQYDAFLKGEAGHRAVKRDRQGRIKAFVGGSIVEPRHGETLVLTIDLVRQSILEEELARGLEEAGGRWATAIAMNPKTGAILAMANAPTYDPNAPGRFSEFAQRNHGVTDQIEPGSTFKLTLAAAALEEGVVKMDEVVDTGEGWAVIAGRTLRDTHGHGRIPFSQVIAQSSNVGTARVAARLKPEQFYRHARALGFGQHTYVDLPGETAGRLKRTAQWSGTSLTSMSIGYEVAVTPLQMLAAYSALANGGLLVQPYLVAERRDVTGRTLWTARQDSVRRAFSARTAAQLIPAFEAVVDSGTAKRAQIPGLRVAGKTGTARKADGGGYNGAYRSSFVGFFPADDPQVALIVVVDEPSEGIYGGHISAPIFQRVAQRWVGTFPQIAARLAPVEPLPRQAERLVPAVAGLPMAVAAHRLREAGFSAPAFDPRYADYPVATTAPASGTAVTTGARVALKPAPAAEAPSAMPDLVGLSAREARYWLALLGVQVRVEGAGVVRQQTPAAGQPLTREAVLLCGAGG